MSVRSAAAASGQKIEQTVPQQLKILDKNRLNTMINSLLSIACAAFLGYMALHGNNGFFAVGAGVEVGLASYVAGRGVQASIRRHELKKEYGIMEEREEMQYTLRDLKNDMKRDLERTIENVQKKFDSMKYMLMTLRK